MIETTVSFFEVIKAKNFVTQYDELYAKYPTEARRGIYFFTYASSSIPYYIGVGEDIFDRLKSHLENYRWEHKGNRYWVTKFPEKLSSLSCFLDVATPETFYIPKRNGDDDGRQKSVAEEIINGTEFLLAHVDAPNDLNVENFKYNVEDLLQTNLIKNMGIQTTWVGDGGRDIGKPLTALVDEIKVRFDYGNLVGNYQRLNEKLLLS